jgi:hypothetical protein
MLDLRIKRNTDGGNDKYKARNINTHQLTDNEAKIVANYLVTLGNQNHLMMISSLLQLEVLPANLLCLFRPNLAHFNELRISKVLI